MSTLAEKNEYRLRPSARLISTIGKDLVKDKFAAVVELVKNAYDADSKYARVKIEYYASEESLVISVADEGDGMDKDTIVNKWLVPATSDKLDRKFSNGGRPLQGRKGIGRFAAAALGDRIYLNTKAHRASEISLLLDLEEFSKDKLLEDIPILVEETKSRKHSGTYIEVSNKNMPTEELKSQWDERQRSNLIIELSKLLAPTEVSKVGKTLGYDITEDVFDIFVEFKGLPNQEDSTIKIEPFGVIDLFDYRIHGTIDEKGNAKFEYFNQIIPSLPAQKCTKKILLESGEFQEFPGKISFDLRVYDRDPTSIDDLINRGLKDPFSDEKVGKRKAREILDAYYGVSLFRGNFRIRPYGNNEFDWLELDKYRIQNPSFKIGHNQVIGFIGIQPEEKSHLEEKSARDGLVEDKYYRGLVHLIRTIMIFLEEKRFEFREKSFRGGRRSRSVNDRIEDLFNFDDITKNVAQKIDSIGIDKNQKNKIVAFISKEIDKEHKKKSEEYKKIKETVALYQGQATLGKITHVILHEGRKHLKVFNEVPTRLVKWATELSKEYDESTFEKLTERSQLLVNSSKSLGLLFKRIEPLAITRRPKQSELNLLKEVSSSIAIFESDFSAQGILVTVDIPKDLTLKSTSFDLATIFANLVENSIYWLSIVRQKNKEIRIEAEHHGGNISIYYSDNGPGFQGTNLDLMFEPGFSMKPGGSGLGLALIGEAIERSNGTIEAKNTPTGALFIINLSRG